MSSRCLGKRRLNRLTRPALSPPASVVGVRERVLGDVPGLVPIQFVLIHQEPHQLGNPDRRVGVIELDRHLLREAIEIIVVSQVKADNVMEGNNKEVLPAGGGVPVLERVVVGIENLRDVLGEGLSTTAGCSRPRRIPES